MAEPEVNKAKGQTCMDIEVQVCVDDRNRNNGQVSTPSDLKLVDSMSPHQVLGIPSSASREQIRLAYRKLVLLCHPDKVWPRPCSVGDANDNSKNFVLLNKAYIDLMKPASSRPAQSDIENRIDAIISEVKENTSCIVIKLPTDSVQSWIDVCTSVYGEPKDQGNNGLKFSCVFSIDPGVDKDTDNVFDDENDCTPRYNSHHHILYE
jgi:hypothetical protein